MNLNQAKKQVDQVVAGLFYHRMKFVSADDPKSQEIYKKTVNEMSQLLMHMKGRLDILFGQDSEALTRFLTEAGITPEPTEN